MKQKLKQSINKMIKVLTCGVTILVSKFCFYADVPTAQTDLGTNIMSFGSNLLNEIAAVYCGSLCWLAFAIEILVLVFSHNDKALGFAKKALIGCIVVFIVLLILCKPDAGVIGLFTKQIGGWASGE